MLTCMTSMPTTHAPASSTSSTTPKRTPLSMSIARVAAPTASAPGFAAFAVTTFVCVSLMADI